MSDESVGSSSSQQPVLVGAWSWRRAVIQSTLPATTRHVLLTLACHASEAGDGCFPGLRTLADETALDQKTVRKHLREAEEAGWIYREERFEGSGRQTTNRYHLTAPPLEPNGEGGTRFQGGGGNQVPGGRGEPGSTPVSLKGTEGKGQKEREIGAESGSHDLGDLFPDSLPNGGGKVKRLKRVAVPIPKSWAPDAEHRAQARRDGVDVEREAEKFRNHALATGRTLRDWGAGFRNWLLNAAEWREKEKPPEEVHWSERLNEPFVPGRG